VAPDALLLPEVDQARKRGVLFDVGHGCGSFSWQTARRAFEYSFYPDTISTDLHRYSVERWARSMPATMAKFLHLGMSIEDVILKSTWAPAQAIGRADTLGTLKSGTVADLFVFELQQGDFPLEDTHFHVEKCHQMIKPLLVIRNGNPIQPGSRSVSLRELYDCDQDVFRLVEETA